MMVILRSCLLPTLFRGERLLVEDIAGMRIKTGRRNGQDDDDDDDDGVNRWW